MDVSEREGGELRQSPVAWNRQIGLSAPLEDLIQLPGVVGNDGIGQERERAAPKAEISDRS